MSLVTICSPPRIAKLKIHLMKKVTMRKETENKWHRMQQSAVKEF